ncbi:MAG: hypothetical protein Unbinned5179contig1004_33 [Prokaryotic dsDNA virus sp.]|nr:MAG: hypothetical protein Unbinned5179contig1004_33 [Prokaryotic dsDNA virus sp.]|tara:strand:+ start:5265 stop:5657 length:393 start_codon:yes stop_codon:yes gene_type:complete
MSIYTDEKGFSYLCLKCIQFAPCKCTRRAETTKTKITKKKVWEIRLSDYDDNAGEELDSIDHSLESIRHQSNIEHYNCIEAKFFYRHQHINVKTSEVLNEWDDTDCDWWEPIEYAPKYVQKAAQHLMQQL